MAKKSKTKESKDSTKKPTKPFRIQDFIGRYHVMIFTVIVGGGLSFMAYSLLMIVNNTNAPDDYMPQTVDSTFNSQTINRLEQLRPTSNSPSQPDMPSGRSDPFPQ